MSKQLNTLAPKKWSGSFSGVAPTLDTSSGVNVGDFAIDTGASPSILWRCRVNTLGAPVWERVSRETSSTVAPTVNDDSGDGYSVGSRWFDTSADKEYVCLDATVGAAVWKETTTTGSSTLPVADTTGIVKGSIDGTKIIRLEADGITTGTTRVWTAQDKDITVADNADLVAHTGNTSNPHLVTAAQAGAIPNSTIAASGDYIRGTGAGTYSVQKNNFAAAVAPTVTDDSSAGYSIGSRWINTVTDKEYVALDVSVGAAVWTETTSTGGGGISSASDKTAAYTVATTDANKILLLTEAATANTTFTMYQLVGVVSNQGNTHYFKNRSSYTLTIKGYQKGTDAAETGSTTTTINATAHGFAVGQIVHITSGAAVGDKRRILTVATNSFTVSALSAAPAAGDTFEVVDGVDDQYSVTLGTNEALTLFGNDDQWLRI